MDLHLVRKHQLVKKSDDYEAALAKAKQAPKQAGDKLDSDVTPLLKKALKGYAYVIRISCRVSNM
jgi:hypothetical protein